MPPWGGDLRTQPPIPPLMSRGRKTAMVLDDVSKAIIEQLQQDGRRSYAAIGKVVGLSEAAVRQRVQRLTESGVMQVVAVTDPMQLGFARQAMVGIRCRGELEIVAEALAELDEVDYVVDHGRHLRPPRRGRLRERRPPARADLAEDPHDPQRREHRDVHVPQAAEADLLVGRSLSASSRDYRVALLVARVDAHRVGPDGRRCRVTATSTSRSSAAASPGCGRRTTWPRPTRR